MEGGGMEGDSMGSVRVDMAQRRDRVRERQSNTESGISYQAIVGRLRELDSLCEKWGVRGKPISVSKICNELKGSIACVSFVGK